MKRILLKSWNRMVALLLLMFTGLYSFAQTSLGDPATDEKRTPSAVFIEFFGVAIVLALICYVGYRYWRNKGAHN